MIIMTYEEAGQYITISGDDMDEFMKEIESGDVPERVRRLVEGYKNIYKCCFG